LELSLALSYIRPRFLETKKEPRKSRPFCFTICNPTPWTMLKFDPLSNFASNRLRSSIGSRRNSRTLSSSKSNAQRTALASAPWRRIRLVPGERFELPTNGLQNRHFPVTQHNNTVGLTARNPHFS
jgi:hypothetical protein